jgi:hypothetical protein
MRFCDIEKERDDISREERKLLLVATKNGLKKQHTSAFCTRCRLFAMERVPVAVTWQIPLPPVRSRSTLFVIINNTIFQN